MSDREESMSDSPYVAIRSDPRDTRIDKPSEESDTIFEKMIGDEHLEKDST